MLDFIVQNRASILVGIAVVILMAAVITKLIVDKKNHKSTCG